MHKAAPSPAAQLIRSSGGGGRIGRRWEQSVQALKGRQRGQGGGGKQGAAVIQSEVKALFLSTAPLSGKCHLGVLQMRL